MTVIAALTISAFLLGGIAKSALDEQDAGKQQAPKQEGLDVRYARAHLALAEANLARVDRANRRVANAVAGVVVVGYQEDLAVAKVRLQAALGESDEPSAFWLRVAEAAAKTADRNWRSAAAANQRAAGTIHELDIERLRLRAEVAQLNLERGRALADASPEDRMQWQIELVHDELQRLDEEVVRNAPGSRMFPIWRY
ncbi:MAG: hypothetical protein HY000_07265 [Planctomycetes bacterium]|nr:hypothetical protein [Planctomycetota bacterium]